MGNQGEETIMNNLNTNSAENHSVDHSTEATEIDSAANAKKEHDLSALVCKVINGLIVTLVVVFTLLLRSDSILSVSHRGFFCDDLSLRYPVKPQTVSTKVLISASTIACVLLVSLSEFYVVRCKKFNQSVSISFKKTFSLPSWVGPSSQVILLYCMGSAANSILTDIGKSVIGWPRPNFMAYCQPNVTCTAEDTNKHTYITNFKCLNLDSQDELEDALKSFPSAHASFAAYVAFFLAFYIQDRFQAFTNCLTLKTVIGPFLQLCIIASFWWSALTRVSDYVHHPLDVLAGLILGTLVATWTRTYLQYLIQAIDQTHKTLKYSLN